LLFEDERGARATIFDDGSVFVFAQKKTRAAPFREWLFLEYAG
jgi:hypothetical protein